MNNNMIEAVSTIAAAHLVKTVADGVRPCCWSIVGFSPKVIENFVEMILDTMPGCELIVDPAYSDSAIDESLLLDPNLASFTKFRHKFENPTFLIRRNAMGEEWEGLEQLETLDPQDLLDDPQLYLDYLNASDLYDDTELKGLEAILKSVITVAHPTLDEVLGYVMAVHKLREGGHLLLTALGEALPELGAFKDESAFHSLKLDRLQPRRLTKLITEVVRDRRDLTLKISASGTSIDKEALIGNLQTAVESGDVSQANEAILQRFILAPADDDKARDAAIALDWQKDGVSLIYRRQNKQTQKLGEKTREHLSWSEDVEITTDEVQLLEQLDSARNPSEDLLDSLRDFYEERRVYIKTERRLNEKWRTLLFQQDVCEDDFLLALIKVTRSLLDL